MSRDLNNLIEECIRETLLEMDIVPTDKNGNIKFSINKWLERYRTHDENGNKLVLGNGTGSCITANNIDTYTVCEPTHVLLQFGHNDMAPLNTGRARGTL